MSTTIVFSALIAELLSTYQNSHVAFGLKGFNRRVKGCRWRDFVRLTTRIWYPRHRCDDIMTLCVLRKHIYVVSRWFINLFVPGLNGHTTALVWWSWMLTVLQGMRVRVTCDHVPHYTNLLYSDKQSQHRLQTCQYQLISRMRLELW